MFENYLKLTLIDLIYTPMTDHIFEKKSGKIEFIGKFEDKYEENDPWNQNLTNKHLYDEYTYSRKMILKNLQKINFETLADVGCGFGKFTYDLKKKFSNKIIDGFDISLKAVNNAKKEYGKYIRFSNHNIAEQPLNKKYDVVMLNQVLYYLLEDYNACFQNIINSTNKFLYFSIFMNENHEYGDLQFKNRDLFIKLMEKNYDLSLKISNVKKINNNFCNEIVFCVN